MEKQREQTYGHGKMRGEGEMYGESTLCKIANGNLLYGSGNSNSSSVTTLEGWDVEGDGSEVQEGGDICISMADSC